MPKAPALFSRVVIIAVLLLSAVSVVSAQSDLSPEVRDKIDKLATDALARSGVPSASIAVVRDGKIVY
jgi:CubicO group peptidase (beta-lactamase class C family)